MNTDAKLANITTYVNVLAIGVVEHAYGFGKKNGNQTLPVSILIPFEFSSEAQVFAKGARSKRIYDEISSRIHEYEHSQDTYHPEGVDVMSLKTFIVHSKSVSSTMVLDHIPTEDEIVELLSALLITEVRNFWRERATLKGRRCM